MYAEVIYTKEGGLHSAATRMPCIPLTSMHVDMSAGKAKGNSHRNGTTQHGSSSDTAGLSPAHAAVQAAALGHTPAAQSGARVAVRTGPAWGSLGGWPPPRCCTIKAELDNIRAACSYINTHSPPCGNFPAYSPNISIADREGAGTKGVWCQWGNCIMSVAQPSHCTDHSHTSSGKLRAGCKAHQAHSSCAMIPFHLVLIFPHESR